MSYTLLIGIALVMGLLMILLFKLRSSESPDGSNHFLLQILILFFIVGGIILMAKATLDVQDPCSWNVINSTTSSLTTSYAYEYQCSPNTHNTSLLFFKSVIWFAGLMMLYIVLFFIYQVLKFIGWVVPKQ